MTGRRRVSIRIEQLVSITQWPAPAFFCDWRCQIRPCGAKGHAIDTTAALNEFADHLRDSHRASGGRVRRRTA